jgi:hypothetical protein
MPVPLKRGAKALKLILTTVKKDNMSEAVLIGGTSFIQGLAHKHGIVVNNYKMQIPNSYRQETWEKTLKLDGVDSLNVIKILKRKNTKNKYEKVEHYLNNQLHHCNTTISLKRTVIFDDDVLLITEVIRTR